MGTEVFSPGLFETTEAKETNGLREYLQVLEDYLSPKYIYDLPKAVGNPDHPDVEDRERKDYYMCRTANIVGAARQIELVLKSGLVAEKGQIQALQRCYREMRRIDARHGLRTEGEMKIIKKDIQNVVDILKGKRIN